LDDAFELSYCYKEEDSTSVCMHYQISVGREMDIASNKNEADFSQEISNSYVRQSQHCDSSGSQEDIQEAEIDKLYHKKAMNEKYSVDVVVETQIAEEELQQDVSEMLTTEEEDLSSLASSYRGEPIDRGIEMTEGYIPQMAANGGSVIADDCGQVEFSLFEVVVYDLDSDVESGTDMDKNSNSTSASKSGYIGSDSWPVQNCEPFSDDCPGRFSIDLDDLQTHTELSPTSDYIKA